MAGAAVELLTEPAELSPDDMESSTDSEKQHLIQASLETAERSEWSEDTSSLPGEWQTDWYCRYTNTTSAAECDARRLAKRKLLFSCALIFVFMTGEMIGGYAAHSLAIMTDAAHLLTDFGSILISIFSLWVSSRPQTKAMTFGWHRAEILGMLLSVGSIWALTAWLVMSAVQRITDGDYDIDSQIMLITSGCAVGINVLMVLILHQSGTSHGHGHSHSHSHGCSTKKLQKNGKHRSHGNASVRAAFIHVVGDLLQSVGVLLAAIIIYFWPELKVADPVCTFLFSVLVLGTTYTVTKDIIRILMQGTPEGVSFDAVKELLLSVKGVVAIHNLHVWSLNMTSSILSVHVVTEEAADSQIILSEAPKLLHSEFGFSSITIQVERHSLSADGGRMTTAEMT